MLFNSLFRPQNGKEFIHNAGPIFKFSLTCARRGDAGHVLCSLSYNHDGATVRLRGYGPSTSPMSIPQMIHELIWNSGLMAGENLSQCHWPGCEPGPLR
jgi:hypothetical protein